RRPGVRVGAARPAGPPRRTRGTDRPMACRGVDGATAGGRARVDPCRAGRRSAPPGVERVRRRKRFRAGLANVAGYAADVKLKSSKLTHFRTEQLLTFFVA